MQFFNSQLRDIVVEEARVEADLRRAIERDEFVLHFQPKVDAMDFRLRSVEALARWQHPERGCLQPTEFIELAEKRGLMPDLGNCVLHLAAKQVHEWMERDFDLPVSINVSAAQFERPQLVSEVLKVLDHHRVDPELIEVEITESMVMSDFVETRRRLRRLQEAGVKVSIDDFGTGFSNLSQLAQLPCDILKIDRSLIAEIGRNSKSEAIIHAIVSMADALGHEIVAEGIETREQLDFLRHVGCLTLQGHLFGEAMSAPDLENWEKARMIGPARAAFENLRMQMESVARLSA
jgi:two-component system CheB/CheR fusion protein